MIRDHLIFDIGFNAGDDTKFYLDKGFAVVAVEANPRLTSTARAKFSRFLEDERLILLNTGLWDSRQTLTFYENLDNDHWSSFDPNYGCRNGTRFRTIDIQCIRIADLFHKYGVPRYLKIDVEGADRRIISDLSSWKGPLPPFISVEEYGVEAVDDINRLGYRHFQFVPQRDKSNQIAPSPAREGVYVNKVFDGLCSGLFGEELPDSWMPFDAARPYFLQGIRNADWSYVGPEHEWFDVHAKL